jgi:sulfatase modifying factor 1
VEIVRGSRIIGCIFSLTFAVACQPAEKEKTTAPVEHSGYVYIKGGTYEVGAKGHPINPKRTIKLDAFYIAPHEVTNAQFSEFVTATNYKTQAEKYHNGRTFRLGLGEFKWADDSTACWKFPNGKEAYGIDDKMDHPVTCISFKDAIAYCEWAGVRLPTVDEWEVASRDNSEQLFFFGKELDSLQHYANIWHGVDHSAYSEKEQFKFTSPVGSFRPNANGLYDVYGNVFELCADRPEFYKDREDVSCARGGSWWCSANSCHYYNSVDIGRAKQIASFSNQGFRVVRKRAK